MQGLIHIYYGDGKGKTTAGTGLCVRGAGAGLRILVYQFLKDGSSSECRILKNISGITVLNPMKISKFTFQMNAQELKDLTKDCEAAFDEVVHTAVNGQYDLLFLDEILHVIHKGLLDETEVLNFLKNKPQNLDVVLTGQIPTPGLLKISNYVTQMKKEKHPFDAGIGARAGIEM